MYLFSRPLLDTGNVRMIWGPSKIGEPELVGDVRNCGSRENGDPALVGEKRFLIV